MTARKTTSARVARLAGKYLNATDDELKRLSLERLFADLRTLAASCLSQDES